MEYLTTISDKDIFPNKNTNQVTKWNLRKTVKVIIKSNEGKIALVTNPIHNCFLLPGGGIDQDEDIFTAADRESREEVMCSITNPQTFGKIEEYRARDGERYETHGIIAQCHEKISDDLRTGDEKKNHLTVVWLTPEEAEKKLIQQENLFREGKIDFYNTGFNIVRDHILFKTAKEKKLF